MVQGCFAGRKVDIYNINYNQSSQLIQKSKSLKEYSLFVHMVNVGISEGLAFGEAVTKAICYCIVPDISFMFHTTQNDVCCDKFGAIIACKMEQWMWLCYNKANKQDGVNGDVS